MRLRPSIYFALCAWLCAFIASTPVLAGTMRLTVQETGGPLLLIDDNAAFDLNPLVGAINANPIFLNAALLDYEFTTLGATSNAGVASTALLTQTGEVNRKSLAPGVSLTVIATNDDYALPLGPLNMWTAATDIFTLSTNVDQHTFQSFYDPNNLKGNTGAGSIPSVLLIHGPGPGSAQSASTSGVGNAPILFALTNRSVIKLGPGVGAPHDQFAGATTVTTIPEPAGTILLMIGAAATLLIRSGKRRSETSR